MPEMLAAMPAIVWAAIVKFVDALDLPAVYAYTRGLQEGARLRRLLGPRGRRNDWQSCIARAELDRMITYGSAEEAEAAWRIFQLYGNVVGPLVVRRCAVDDTPDCANGMHNCFDTRAPYIALLSACMEGDWEKMRWCSRHLPLSRQDTLRGLRDACGRGDIDVVEFLTSQFTINYAYLLRCGGFKLFRAACGNGHLRVAQWIAERLGPRDAQLAAQERNYGAFIDACAGGHLPVVEWLAAALGVAGAARVGECVALRRACAGGHLPVARWLVAHFGLGPVDLSACDGWARRRAALAGRVEVVVWIDARLAVYKNM